MSIIVVAAAEANGQPSVNIRKRMAGL